MRVPRKVYKTNVILSCIAVVGLMVFVKNMNQVDMSASTWGGRPFLVREQAQHIDIISTQPPPKKVIRHVAFLKVHKAASSTAQNIFLRFGWFRNLTFVLAPAKNKFGYPNIISLRESLTKENILPPPPNRAYEILCNHVFYTNEAFSTFMPNDTAYVGILREPFEQYKSTLNYFRPAYIFKKINGQYPASEYLRNPSKYEPSKVKNSWTHNRQALEFGFPEELWLKFNATAVNSYLKKLDKEFKVVIIAELFEESVIIMRRLFNWRTKDVIYLDQNIAKHKNETRLSKDYDRSFYKRYSKLDYTLYEFFFKRLREQIRSAGAEFDSEYLHFKELRKNLGEFCRQTTTQEFRVPKTDWDEAFIVTRDDCAQMRRGEIDFVQRIRLRQYGSKDI